jgi:Uma2 family endonuclease
MVATRQPYSHLTIQQFSNFTPSVFCLKFDYFEILCVSLLKKLTIMEMTLIAETPILQETTHASPIPNDVTIPEALIYEMVNGRPIYYKGWKAVLRGEKTIEQIMASSLLQSYLVYEIGVAIHPLRKKYIIGSNEAGLKFQKGDYRAADIALWTKESLKTVPLSAHYAEVIPDIVIEVDTKADISADPDYIFDKTSHLIQQGVRRVIWILTKTKKVMIAEKDKNWSVVDWSETVLVTEGCQFNVVELLADYEEQTA